MKPNHVQLEHANFLLPKNIADFFQKSVLILAMIRVFLRLTDYTTVICKFYNIDYKITILITKLI